MQKDFIFSNFPYKNPSVVLFNGTQKEYRLLNFNDTVWVKDSITNEYTEGRIESSKFDSISGMWKYKIRTINEFDWMESNKFKRI